jgi:hypothetical protein
MHVANDHVHFAMRGGPHVEPRNHDVHFFFSGERVYVCLVGSFHMDRLMSGVLIGRLTSTTDVVYAQVVVEQDVANTVAKWAAPNAVANGAAQNVSHVDSCQAKAVTMPADLAPKKHVGISFQRDLAAHSSKLHEVSALVLSPQRA